MSEVAATNATKKQPAPEKPADSPQTVAARALKADLGHIVDVLQKGDFALRISGAALFAAHMGNDLGREKAAKLTAKEVQEYAARFRSRYPAAWGRAASSHAMGFIRALKSYGFTDEDLDTVEEYQKAVGALVA